MRNEMIDILIVDDSAIFRKFLVHIIESAGGMRVAGTASNGIEAIDHIKRAKPDIILMDINMPGMDGFDTTAEIMSTVPIPIIIISGEYTPLEVAKTFRALEVGAVDILPKPPGPSSPNYNFETQRMVTHIRLMSEIKVVRRDSAVSRKPDNKAKHENRHDSPTFNPQPYKPPSVIGIGASAGGPIVIQSLLKGLTPDFDIPIVIVQHIEPAFAEGFAQWLEMTTGRKVVCATDGMPLTRGMIVLPPGDSHLGFKSHDILDVSLEPPKRGLRPSVDHLFLSMANTYGNLCVGIILTGMGRDGTEGLSFMREKGAFTIVQDQASSMINGMPGEAIKAGAAQRILSPELMIICLNELNSQKNTI